MLWSTLSLCLIFLGTATAEFRNEDRPNILLLFPDQWRFDFDGRNASEEHFLPLELPNIRKLTQEGTQFLHCYTPSPLCAPARAAVASGRDYDDTGVPDNNTNDYNVSIPTFYTALGKAGYHVMTVGKDDLSKATQCGTKTHQGDWRGYYHQAELGFSDGLRSGGKWDVVSPPNAPHERYGHWLTKQPPLTLKNGTKISAWDAHVKCVRGDECSEESFPDELYGDDFVTRNAIRMLRNRKPKNQPWFLQVNFPGPHPPFLVTSRQHSAVDGRVFPPPVDNPKYIVPRKCNSIDRPSPSQIDRCSYAAECEHLDSLFGSILDELENNRERDNTIICFSSDHGEMLGDHGLVGKTVPWQGSASVPLICAGPNIQVGMTIHRAVSTKDLAATFLDYATNSNLDIQEELLPPPSSSKSLRSLLETGLDDNYHPYIQSGLLTWRMVVDSLSGLKLICCRGHCKSSGRVAHGKINQMKHPPIFDLLIFNTTNDPFDMYPLNAELPVDEVVRLRRMLAHGFCEENKR